MTIIEKIFEMREDDLVSISPKEKEEILKLCPYYYGTSELKTLIKDDVKLKKHF